MALWVQNLEILKKKKLKSSARKIKLVHKRKIILIVTPKCLKDNKVSTEEAITRKRMWSELKKHVWAKCPQTWLAYISSVRKNRITSILYSWRVAIILELTIILNNHKITIKLTPVVTKTQKSLSATVNYLDIIFMSF